MENNPTMWRKILKSKVIQMYHSQIRLCLKRTYNVHNIYT